MCICVCMYYIFDIFDFVKICQLLGHKALEKASPSRRGETPKAEVP